MNEAPSFGASGQVLTGCLLHAVAAPEPLDAAGGVDDAVLTGEERVALAADFSPQTFFCGTDFPRIAARTCDGRVIEVFRMNFGFHIELSPGSRDPPGAIG